MKETLPNLAEIKKAADDNKNTPRNPQGSNIPVSSPEGAAIMCAVEITKELTRCYTDYAKCKQHEITERKRITATLKAMQYYIDAQKEIFLVQIEKEYEERNRLYDALALAQKKAMEDNDREMLKDIMYCMIQVFQSPLKAGSKCAIDGLIGTSQMRSF